MYCDASCDGISGILLQNRRPVAYESRKLIPAEENYAPTELEMLAVDHCCKVWRCYIEGRKTIVFTDHKPNTSYSSQHMTTRRHARWLDRLQGFDLEWRYTPGEENIADGLSRHPYDAPVIGAILTGHQRTRKDKHPLQMVQDKDFIVRLKSAYAHDEVFMAKAKAYYCEDGLYYFGGRLMLPSDPDIINKVLMECHSSHFVGHLGREKTLKLVSRYFSWPKMHLSVKNFVKNCDSCQRNKSRNVKPGGWMMPTEIPDGPWQWVTMDFITQLPPTVRDHSAIFVMVDKFTKMVHLAPCKDTTSAVEVAQLFRENVVRFHGTPAHIITDRDSRFTSQFWKAFCQHSNITHSMTSAFHPQSDGNTERVNRTLEQMLRHIILPDQSDWDEYLYLVEFCINNSDHESIGTTPFFLNYGRHPDIPISAMVRRHRVNLARKAWSKGGGRKGKTQYHTVDAPYISDLTNRMQSLVQRTKAELAAAQQRQKYYYDLRTRDVEFKVGQQVLLSTKNLSLKVSGVRKLMPCYIGPFPITQVINPNAMRLKLPDALKVHDVFHVSLLSPYRSDGKRQPPPLPELVDNELYYEVDSIDQHRDRKVGHKKRREYLVNWKGQDLSHSTWEPAANLTLCSESIQEYWARKKGDHVAPKSRKRKKSGTGSPTNTRSTRRVRIELEGLAAGFN